MLSFNLSSYYDKNAERGYGVFAPQEERKEWVSQAFERLDFHSMKPIFSSKGRTGA
jgi:hypothetical protein